MSKKITWKGYDYTIQAGPDGSWLPRPLIEVVLTCPESSEKVAIMAMVDSGTDGTIFHAQIAETLRIDKTKCKRGKIGGIGSLEGFRANVGILIPDFHAKLEIPVFFAENLPLDGLLGQKHFFQRFKIRFEKDIGKFFLALS